MQGAGGGGPIGRAIRGGEDIRGLKVARGTTKRILRLPDPTSGFWLSFWAW